MILSYYCSTGDITNFLVIKQKNIEKTKIENERFNTVKDWKDILDILDICFNHLITDLFVKRGF